MRNDLAGIAVISLTDAPLPRLARGFSRKRAGWYCGTREFSANRRVGNFFFYCKGSDEQVLAMLAPLQLKKRIY
jgi:hypothetical protein